MKRRVWVGLGFAVVAILAWWGWTRTRLPAVTAAAPPPQPFVRIAGAGNATADQILRERADLLDPTPLFFPTNWNYGQRAIPERLRHQPGHLFGSFDPKFTIRDENLKSYGRETARGPEKLADVLVQGNDAPFAGIGQMDGSLPPLSQRAAFVEVRGFLGSDIVIQQSVTDIVLPRSDFAPLEFVVAVGSAGVVGEPMLTSGSGWEEVDAFFRVFLVKTFRLGERLAPGSYRVLVGP